jgi:hypothetical protein
VGVPVVVRDGNEQIRSRGRAFIRATDCNLVNAIAFLTAALASHLNGGADGAGVSVTDPCIDWPTTERCILESYEMLRDIPIASQPAAG